MNSSSLDKFCTPNNSNILSPFNLVFLAIIITFTLLLAWMFQKPEVGIILALGVGICLVMVLFYNYHFYLSFLFPLVYFYTNNYIYLVLVVLLLVSFLAYKFASTDTSLKIPYGYNILFILLLGAIAITSSVKPELGRFFYQYSLLLPIFVFIVIYNSQLGKKDIHNHIRMAGLVMALVGFLSIIHYSLYGAYRQIITWGSNNIASSMFGMLIPLTLSHIYDDEQKAWKKIDVIIALGLIMGLVITQTRSILFVTLLTVIYLARYERRILKLFIPGLVLTIALIPSIIGRIMMLFGVGVIPDWSAVGRIQIWKNSMALLKEHWFWGLGVYSFYHRYNALFPFSFINAEHPHNIYLRMIFDYGIIVTILFYAIIFSILYKGLKRAKHLYKKGFSSESKLMFSINASLIVILLGGLMDSFLTVYVALFFWSLCAFQVLLLERTRKYLA